MAEPKPPHGPTTTENNVEPIDAMSLTTSETSKIILDHGVLFYLYSYTDFLCHLPKWIFDIVEEELFGEVQ